MGFRIRVNGEPIFETDSFVNYIEVTSALGVHGAFRPVSEDMDILLTLSRNSKPLKVKGKDVGTNAGSNTYPPSEPYPPAEAPYLTLASAQQAGVEVPTLEGPAAAMPSGYEADAVAKSAAGPGDRPENQNADEGPPDKGEGITREPDKKSEATSSRKR